MPNIKGAMFAADDNIIFFGTDSNIFILHKKNDLVIRRILYKLNIDGLANEMKNVSNFLSCFKHLHNTIM